MRALVAILVILGGAAPTARAQRLVADMSGRLACVTWMTCEEDSECNSAHPTDSCSSGLCQSTSGDSADYKCCQLAGPACADEAPCIPFVDSPFGTCENADEARPLCHDSSDVTDVVNCFAGPSWGDGDCDVDGILNRDEEVSSDIECACYHRDRSTSPAPCYAPVDGGVASDAGGAGGIDAGRDDEVPPKPQWDYRGSGGCTCDTAGADADARTAWLALGLVVVLGARRRRRSRGGR